MHHRTLAALRSLRQDLATRLDEAAVHDACRRAGHRWRDCLLTPVAILRWFVVQVLHGNTALTHVSLLAGRSFTDAAFCQARARLPLAAYQAVLRGLNGALVPDTRTQGTWRGHRTFLVDGSSFSMPDTPELRAHFGTSGRAKPGCSFPVARHPGPVPRRHRDCCWRSSRPRCGPTRWPPSAASTPTSGRATSWWGTAASARSCTWRCSPPAAPMRCSGSTPGRSSTSRRTGRTSAATPGRQAKGRPRSRWLRRLGERDQVVEWFKPSRRPEWLAEDEFAALPASLTVRELRYEVGRPGYRTRSVTLVTTPAGPGGLPAPASWRGSTARGGMRKSARQTTSSRCGLYPSARSPHSGRGGAAGAGPLVPGDAGKRHPRATAMRSDSERPVPPARGRPGAPRPPEPPLGGAAGAGPARGARRPRPDGGPAACRPPPDGPEVAHEDP